MGEIMQGILPNQRRGGAPGGAFRYVILVKNNFSIFQSGLFVHPIHSTNHDRFEALAMIAWPQSRRKDYQNQFDAFQAIQGREEGRKGMGRRYTHSLNWARNA